MKEEDIVLLNNDSSKRVIRVMKGLAVVAGPFTFSERTFIWKKDGQKLRVIQITR